MKLNRISSLRIRRLPDMVAAEMADMAEVD